MVGVIVEESPAERQARPQTPDQPGRVLVVDDDPAVADIVRRYLVRDGHAVECVHDGYQVLRRVAEAPPDLVVLDLMLPGMDGLEVCRRLRARWPIPVIMLTALGDETDRLVGFETGADDYVTKPFSPRELALRVRSVLRRVGSRGLPGMLGTIIDGDLVVDLSVRRLREKLEPDPTLPKRIVTSWGIGYRYEPGAGDHDAR
jgi:DNA-binding response OmpR family regulator